MADLVVTEALVTSNNTTQTYRSYETDVAVTAGELLAEDTTTGNLILAVADTEDNARLVGVALTSSTGAGEFVVVAERGTYVTGATMVAGTYYVLSATAGKIAPFPDLITGNITSYAIMATSTTQAQIVLYNTTIVVA